MPFLPLTSLLRRQYTRSFSPRNRVAKVVGMVVLGAYVTLVLTSLGFLFTETMRRWVPEQDPVFWLNQHLLGVFGGLFMLRLAFQRTPKMDITRFLHLPISRGKLVTFFQISSLLNLHTLLPLLFFFPYWVRHFLLQAWPGDSPATWLAGVVCVLLLSHFTLIFVRTLPGKALRVLLAAAAVVLVLFALRMIPLERWSVQASVIIFTGLRNGDAAMLVFLAALTAMMFGASSLLVRMRLLADPKRDRKGWLANHVHFAARYGEIPNLVLMELQLIWRNRRPRSVLNYSALFGTVPVVLLLLEPTRGISVFGALTALLATGSFAINYGQLMFSWESRYFDGFLMRRHELKHIVYAKLLLLQASCLVFYVVSFPLFLGLAPHLVNLHFAFLLYNGGVNATLLLALALQNEQRIDPQRSGVTNYEGFTLRHLLLFIPTMIPPLVILYGFRSAPETGILVLGSLGVAGLLLSVVWSNLLAGRLAERKYEMAYGFKRYDY